MRTRVAALLVLAALTLPSVVGAHAQSLGEIQEQLAEAREERARLEERVGAAVAAYDQLQARIGELEADRELLQSQLSTLRDDLDELTDLMVLRVRETFKHGSSLDPLMVFLASDDPDSALVKAETVQRVVAGDQARSDELTASRARVRAAEERLADHQAELDDALEEQEALAEALQADFERVQQLEARLVEAERAEKARLERERLERERRERERREREERERREAAAREAAARSSSGGGSTASSGSGGSSGGSGGGSSGSGGSSGGSGGGSSGSGGGSGGSGGGSGGSSGSGGGSSGSGGGSGGMACPLDQPRSFTDTWGAPRSGGRSHRGTDIMGPHGIPVRAITSGTWHIQRQGPSAGLWGILRGDNGDQYWYLHLASHTVSSGARVSAGQQVATNGATGNAPPNAPHVHFERHPGGGSAVNPYPLLRQVCG